MNNIIEKIISELKHKPTKSQITAIKKISNFLFNDIKVFVLLGYAGTGKTTLVSSFINVIDKLNIQYVLLAPTGRAAKVLSSYSKKSAFTIHKKIYNFSVNENGLPYFSLRRNQFNNTIFIIDEASMISNYNENDSFIKSHNLLSDIFKFVFSGKNNKLLFIGDSAQLPPIGMDKSPALDINFLNNEYNYTIDFAELTDTVRQSETSEILIHATYIRNCINNSPENLSFENFKFPDAFGKDVFNLSSENVQNSIFEAYNEYDVENTLIICRTNKRTNLYNKYIRNYIINREGELNAGDRLMIVKNNYFWLNYSSDIPFIANGDFAEVVRIKKIKELYNLKFAEVSLRLSDYPESPLIEANVILDTLYSDEPNLSLEKQKDLYKNIEQDYIDIPSPKARYLKIKKDPYFNALQTKFAYAITCHKAQGGQWKAVFIEQGYISQNDDIKGFLKWLYTAITRATEKVYLINFDKKFFSS